MTHDERVRAAANAVLTLSAEVARLRAENEKTRKAFGKEHEEKMALRADLDRALDALRGMVNLYGWFPTPEPEPLRVARAVLADHDREPHDG